jgi:hypothetical protein
VLVVALALLVLSATVMVGLSRAAIRHAAAARDAQAELQRRYGSMSIRRTVLPRAESILAGAEAVSNTSLPSLRRQIRLGNFAYELIVGDEQSKANLNRLAERSDGQSIEMRLMEALSGTGLGRRVRVTPAPLTLHEGAGLAHRFTGIGQVFDLTRLAPEQLLQLGRTGPAPIDLVTVWGDGRINLRRASATSARLVLVPPLSSIEVEKLLAGAGEQRSPQPNEPTDPLTRLLAQVNVPHSLEGRSIGVTLASTCHSIWVIADDSRRRWCEMEVLDTTDPDRPILSYFSW